MFHCCRAGGEPTPAQTSPPSLRCYLHRRLFLLFWKAPGTVRVNSSSPAAFLPDLSRKRDCARQGAPLRRGRRKNIKLRVQTFYLISRGSDLRAIATRAAGGVIGGTRLCWAALGTASSLLGPVLAFCLPLIHGMNSRHAVLPFFFNSPPRPPPPSKLLCLRLVQVCFP